MRTIKFGLGVLVITTILSLSGCTMQSGLTSYDDVYYNPSDTEQYQEVEKRTNQLSTNDNNNQNYEKSSRAYNEKLKNNDLSPNNQEVYQEQDTIYDSSYQDYNEDDYYDYAYSARIRRFHNPYVWSGYYDDYYTNLYWYNSDPFYWGTSIYLGYNWWYPSYYNPYYNGFGYNYWGYGYNPYNYGWGYPNNVCYYNSRDHNSNFNRPRSSFDPNNGALPRGGSGHISDGNSGKTFGDKYNSRYGNVNDRGNRNNNNRTGNTTIANNRTRPNNLQNNRFSNLDQKQNPIRTNNRFNKPVRIESRTINNDNRQINNNNQRSNDNRRDNSRVINNNNNNNNNRTYTPPSSRQPRTNNQFRTNTRRSYDAPTNNNNNRSFNNNINRSNNNSNIRTNNNSSRSTYTPSSSSSRSSGSSNSGSSRSGGSSSSRSGGGRR